MKFGTAIIDPPWAYREVNGTDNNLGGFMSHEGKKIHYRGMAFSELKKLPVGELVDGYLFMWTAKTFLREGLTLMRRWGFTFKSYLIWHKHPGLGVGYWFRGDCEMVMVGVKKGKPSLRTNESDTLVDDENDIFIHRRIGHSTKPPMLHSLIEKQRPVIVKTNACGHTITTPTNFPGPYLEIFGREKEGVATRQGWVVIGNEANRTRGEDILVSMQNLIVLPAEKIEIQETKSPQDKAQPPLFF